METVGNIVERVTKEVLNKVRTSGQNENRPFERIWGEDVAFWGFTQVPYLLQIHPGLKPTEKVVLSFIIGQGRICYAKSTTIARSLGISVDYVRKIIKRLLDDGWMIRSNVYVGVERKRVRILDWAPTVAKLKAFARSEKVYMFVTKHVRKRKRKRFQGKMK